MFDSLVLVTRKTRLQGLVERFNTRAQAKFYLEHAGLDFDDYQREDDVYRRALDQSLQAVDFGLKLQTIERALLPTFMFSNSALVIAIGQDGLVANTAKYIGAQPLIGVNPDPQRFDGVLLPFSVDSLRRGAESALTSKARIANITLAQATLNDGQKLLGFNDIFIGSQTHVSAQYRVRIGSQTAERQSSSGIIISTGAGSTGWLSSVFNMASAMSQLMGGPAIASMKFDREDPRLFFTVREPFVSHHSSAECVGGFLHSDAVLEVESLMTSGGVIFSDGVEKDFLEFNSGAVARISAAAHRAKLVLA